MVLCQSQTFRKRRRSFRCVEHFHSKRVDKKERVVRVIKVMASNRLLIVLSVAIIFIGGCCCGGSVSSDDSEGLEVV